MLQKDNFQKSTLLRLVLRWSYYCDLRTTDSADDSAELFHVEEALLHGSFRGFGCWKIVWAAEVVLYCCWYSSDAIADSLLTDSEVRITYHCLLRTTSCTKTKCDRHLSFYSQRHSRATPLPLQLGVVSHLVTQPSHCTVLKCAVFPKNILDSLTR